MGAPAADPSPPRAPVAVATPNGPRLPTAGAVAARAHPRRWPLLAGACLQNGTTTGLLFGFAALAPALQALELGDDQPVDTSEVFTLAASANMLAPLVFAGPVLDALGPRSCACACTFLVGAGFLLFGVSHALPGRDMDYLMPAMVLIGVGGPGCQSSLFHTANLFPKRGFALNVITASIGPSFMVFELLVKLADWLGVTLQQAFLLYSLVPFACAFLGALTMSDTPFHSSECPEPEQGSPPPSPSSPRFDRNLAAFHSHMVEACSPHHVHCATHRTRHARKISLGAARPMVFLRRKRNGRQVRSLSLWSHSATPRTPRQPLLDGSPSAGTPPRSRTGGGSPADFSSPGGSSGAGGEVADAGVAARGGESLRDQLLSGAFAELSVVFIVNSLFYNLFLGNMQVEAQAALLAGPAGLSAGTPEETAGAAAGEVSTYLRFSPLSVFLNPVLGYCIDRYGFSPVVALMFSSGVCHATALWLGAFAPAVVAFSIFANSNFAYMFSYLAFEFGFNYYGLLAGVIQAMAGVATLALQPQLKELAAARGWPFVQLIQVVSLALLLAVIIARVLTQRESVNREACRKGPLPAPLGDEVWRQSVRGSPDSLCSTRSYSLGDIHDRPADQPCRRRTDLFPHVDDILVIDGANPHHSRVAYLMDGKGPPLHEQPP